MSAIPSGFEFIQSITQIKRHQWQGLLPGDNPFVSFDYLYNLEATGATGGDSGWQPMHLVHRDTDGQIDIAVPLYLKDDSWGEFVFDFSWAEAHHRHGISYYPKLVTAIPYTPVPGPRILTAGNLNEEIIRNVLVAISAKAEETGASSWHILFLDAGQLEVFNNSQLLIRKDCQYHWFNQDYRSFDHYLQSFRSAQRKKTRRERRKISDAGVRIETSYGHELDETDWIAFYELYASTFQNRGRMPYFDRSFFQQLAKSDTIRMLIIWARKNGNPIAASMFFVTDDVLYGRYWGSNTFVDGLHFELCYYQGIDYCIEHQISKFDPGVQGEHKIARGFQASPSWSAHWMRYAPFSQAIGDYLERERPHIDAYMEQVDQHLPFRKNRDQDS